MNNNIHQSIKVKAAIEKKKVQSQAGLSGQKGADNPATRIFRPGGG
jgi:hypothetical protein